MIFEKYRVEEDGGLQHTSVGYRAHGRSFSIEGDEGRSFVCES